MKSKNDETKLNLEKKIMGAAWEAFEGAYAGKKEKVKAAFFQPYTGPSDVALRAVNIVSGPVLFGIGAVYGTLMTLELAFKFMYQAATKNQNAEKTKNKVKDTAFATSLAFVFAVIGALINLVDFLGSMIPYCKKDMEYVPATAPAPNAI